MDKLNLDTTDRILRVLLGFLLVYIALYADLSAGAVWLLTLFGMVLIITAISGVCPFYRALKISSIKK